MSYEMNDWPTVVWADSVGDNFEEVKVRQAQIIQIDKYRAAL
jgi:hypothetical protein